MKTHVSISSPGDSGILHTGTSGVSTIDTSFGTGIPTIGTSSGTGVPTIDTGVPTIGTTASWEDGAVIDFTQDDSPATLR